MTERVLLPGVTMLHLAAWDGDLDAVASGVDRSGADINSADRSGWTPLHVAAYRGHRRVVHSLLRRGALVDQREKMGQTALHVAAYRSHCGVARMLVHLGASPDLPDYAHWTPLHVAAYSGHGRMAALLLDAGAEVDKPSDTHWTPLHLAVWQRDRSVAKVLLDHGASVSKPCDREKWSPLHIAVCRWDLELIAFLVSQGAEIDAVAAHGWTPLHLASHRGDPDAVRFLVKSGADVHRRDDAGLTPRQLKGGAHGTVFQEPAVPHPGRALQERTMELLHEGEPRTVYRRARAAHPYLAAAVACLRGMHFSGEQIGIVLQQNPDAFAGARRDFRYVVHVLRCHLEFDNQALRTLVRRNAAALLAEELGPLRCTLRFLLEFIDKGEVRRRLMRDAVSGDEARTLWEVMPFLDAYMDADWDRERGRPIPLRWLLFATTATRIEPVVKRCHGWRFSWRRPDHYRTPFHWKYQDLAPTFAAFFASSR